MYIRIFTMDVSQTITKTYKNRETSSNDLEATRVKPAKCPRGTRRNKRTGGCEPIAKPTPPPAGATDPIVNQESTMPVTENLEEEIEGKEIEGTEIEGKEIEENPSAIEEEIKDAVPDPPIQLAPSQTKTGKLVINDVLAALPKNSNAYKRQKEKIEFDTRSQHTEYPYLYPDLDDPEFALKLAAHKEFNDTQYDGSIHNVQEYADKMCFAEFELLPHQIFVKNFLSLQTPYNSLLLYHGLGSGKTCSAIGIAEEMRSYMKQIGIKQRIIVVAAPNVQANFKLQLFDERRLREVDGVWNITSCIGNALIKEVNPTSLKGIPKERVVAQIRSIINQNYVFMGYVELANYIRKKTSVPKDSGFSIADQRKIEIQNIRRFFDNRLIVIDEVHNIRLTNDNQESKTAFLLMKLAKYTNNMRLLLLSATPMYNSHTEIIWLVNLMNGNDKRGLITAEEVFENDGTFKEPKKGENRSVVEEGGRELLHRKLIGYVSYVRGENPYTFPYRIYPSEFALEHTFSEPASTVGSIVKAGKALVGQATYQHKLPTVQLNGKEIAEPLQFLPLYVTTLGEYQEKAYQLVIEGMRKDTEAAKSGSGIPEFDEMDRFGFRRLQTPLEALNIVYPSERLDMQIQNGVLTSDSVQEGSIADEEYTGDPRGNMVGKRGMNSVMTFIDDSRKRVPLKYGFKYRPEVLEKYGRIFQADILSKYSAKIAAICDNIRKSTGIVMIYSQYIDGGVVPLALALEEMGFARYSASADHPQTLFEKPPTEPLDAMTMKPKSQLDGGRSFNHAKYVMITGDKAYSPQNADDLKQVTSTDNTHGELVKVVLISKAGSEGLDFKCIRQIHLLEPWYNMNRAEQIIGRGVRNLSHCMLPFSERNVEIYMHGTRIKDRPDEEAADVYVYRLAEKKASIIGRVTRIIKETAVDCVLNIGQTNFTQDKFADQTVELTLSTDRKRIQYKMGDRPHTDICDYMEDCAFKCSPSGPTRPILEDTYSTQFVDSNNGRIMQRIRQLYRDERNGQHFYNLSELIDSINITKQYPVYQIYAALTAFTNNKTEYLVDKYGRRGNLVNRGDIYAFQPIEINDEAITVFERSVPVDYKRQSVGLEIPKEFPAEKIQNEMSKIPDKTDPDAEYRRILGEIVKHVEYASSVQEIAQGDQNWYKHASRVFNQLQIVHEIGFGELVDYVIQHNVDFLMPADKLIVVSHFYSKVRDFTELGEVEKVVKEYLDTKMITLGNKTVFFVAEQANWMLYVQSQEDPTIWIEAEPEDVRNFEQAGLLRNQFEIRPDMYSKIMGFIDMFHSGKEMVFRIKDVTQMQNNRGTRISAQTPGKGDIIKRLNEVIGTPMYSLSTSKEIMQMGLGVILEMILRHYTESKREDKVWFMNPEDAMYSGISKYRRPV
jgi:hypothetical protein